ncbi:kinetochore protein NDC80 homolog [Mantella aurantiaca]
MENQFPCECSWIPPRDKDGRRSHPCCHLPNIRRKSPSCDCSLDPAAVRQRAKILHQFLEVYGYTLESPETCRCRESSFHGSRAAARFLHPLFRFLGGRHEDDLSGLYRDQGCPFDLLHSVFLKLESARRWHRLVMAVPWLQDLLEGVSHAFWTPRPQETCVSCRKWQAAGSEVGMSDRKPKSHRERSPSKTLPKTLPRCRTSLQALSELWSNIYQKAEPDLPGKGADESGRHEGHYAPVQELKNSLKVDLEKHQHYLTHIESRLSSLESRAEDVTRYLEKANQELKAIKRGSVTLQTLVDQQTSPVTEDLEDWDLQVLDSLMGDVTWNGDPLQTPRARYDRILQLADLHWTGDSIPKLERSPPTAGSRRDPQGDVESGISQCQDQINVLLHQISRQIDQTEMDLNIAISRVCRG